MTNYEKIRRSAAKIGRDAYVHAVQPPEYMSWKNMQHATDAAISFYNAALGDVSEQLQARPLGGSAFDFACWLTTRPTVIKVGGSETVYAMFDALKEFQALETERAAEKEAVLGPKVAERRETYVPETDLHTHCGADAREWAHQFAIYARMQGYSDMDEGWLIGWFANAIEASWAKRIGATNASIKTATNNQAVDVDTLLTMWGYTAPPAASEYSERLEAPEFDDTVFMVGKYAFETLCERLAKAEDRLVKHFTVLEAHEGFLKMIGYPSHHAQQ